MEQQRLPGPENFLEQHADLVLVVDVVGVEVRDIQAQTRPECRRGVGLLLVVLAELLQQGRLARCRLQEFRVLPPELPLENLDLGFQGTGDEIELLDLDLLFLEFKLEPPHLLCRGGRRASRPAEQGRVLVIPQVLPLLDLVVVPRYNLIGLFGKGLAFLVESEESLHLLSESPVGLRLDLLRVRLH